MGALFHAVLFQPILNLLVLCYDLLFKDMGLAILAMTLVIRGLLWPLTHKSLHSQRAMLEIQPKMNEIKEKIKDKEAQAKAMMELYKNEKISPFSSCLPLLIQLPLFIALYSALRSGLASANLSDVYPFVPNPGHLSTTAFGFLDLSKAAAGANLLQPYWPALIVALLAAGAQYLQARMMQMRRPEVKGKGSDDEDMAAMMNKQMLYMMPAMTLLIGWKLPVGLTFYWLLTNGFMVVQQYFFFKGRHKHREPGVDAPPAVPKA